MTDLSIIAGKMTVQNVSSRPDGKRMYIKVFPGAFTMKAPRPKKAKVLSGELLIRYSAREWPVNKNGSLVGNMDFLNGLSDLLKEVSIENVKDISWSAEQREIKDTVTIAVGSALARELIDRGWAQLSSV